MLNHTAKALMAAFFALSILAAPATYAEAAAEGVEAAEQATAETSAAKKTELENSVGAGIFLKKLAFENMEGRTGILAEKPLYSAFAEEVIIRDFFQDREGGFFLDVGAAWAVKASNTYYLEKNLGWTGIGIDALIDYAPEWEEKRPNSKFANYLVTDKSGGEGVFYKSESLGLSSTKKNMAQGKMFGGKKEPEEIRVPMITLNDLLDKEGVKKVDLISMDIEGHEPAAFAGFDIERFAPELLVVEGKNKWVKEYLAEHGYIQIERYKKFDSVNGYYARADEAGQ